MSLVDYLQKLASDPQEAILFRNDPDAAMDTQELSQDARDALKGRDSDRIKAIAAEEVSQLLGDVNLVGPSLHIQFIINGVLPPSTREDVRAHKTS